MVAQYYYGKDHADDAEVQYQKGIFGLKLVLSYIRASSLCYLLTRAVFFYCLRSLMSTCATICCPAAPINITGREPFTQLTCGYEQASSRSRWNQPSCSSCEYTSSYMNVRPC